MARTDQGKEADNEAWMGVWFAVFDAYTWDSRYFLLWELAAAVVLGGLQTVQAHSEAACLGRAAGVGAVVLMLLAKVVCSRPFLTLFENASNALLLGGELVVVVLSIVHTETGEDASEAAGEVVSECVTWGMLVQFVVCTAMFIRDRYAEWHETTGKRGAMRFAAHWLCFADVMHGIIDPADVKPSVTKLAHQGSTDTSAVACPLLPATECSAEPVQRGLTAEEAALLEGDLSDIWDPEERYLVLKWDGVIRMPGDTPE
eukprot:TRINITY_DN1579_c0_g2_i1.p1 TRINITY_DN1579_c0_g2~~TRINITY_DN1579_c0_g2_i1.p1  ORF type:complete len:259 (+),score=74.97 TRINITY_DN1579_c0_g2_i1:1-777(+)